MVPKRTETEESAGEAAEAPRAIFPVDHTFRPLQRGVQLGSTIHFRAIFDLVIEALKPATICEIGMEAGVVSQHLAARARELGGRYIGIDPIIAPSVRAALGDGAHVTLYAEKSLDVLPRIPMPDLTLIDGDHNYYTVRAELTALLEGWEREKRKPFAILMHDTSWPCARRDTYYDPAGIPPRARHDLARGRGFSIGSDRLLPRGYGADANFAIAERWGGPANGVLTALEDVLAGRDDLRVTHVPAAFGLSVVCPADAQPPAFAAALTKLVGGLEVFGELLAGLEYARLVGYDMYRRERRRSLLKAMGRWLAAPVKVVTRRRPVRE
jgi:hypothetical protein